MQTQDRDQGGRKKIDVQVKVGVKESTGEMKKIDLRGRGWFYSQLCQNLRLLIAISQYFGKSHCDCYNRPAAAKEQICDGHVKVFIVLSMRPQERNCILCE